MSQSTSLVLPSCQHQMRPYVARVLEHPANWMVYSTALLERSWLDFESQYGRERAVLQIQVRA